MSDNPFVIETSGQADWDSALSANFQVIERGYHVTERAGIAISTGQFLSLNSAGYFAPYNSTTGGFAHAYAYTAAASGDSFTALAWGIVRSLSVNSAILPGMAIYANGSGFAVGSGDRQLGWGLSGSGILINPAKIDTSSLGSGGATYSPTYFTAAATVVAVVGSLHTFTMSLGGLFGWNRRLRMNSASASLVELKLYRDAGLTDMQYATLSGGITATPSGSFNDRAAFPFDTDSGTLYGTFQIFSHSVGSDTVAIIGAWEV